MNLLSDLRNRLDRLSAWSELDVDAVSLPSSAAQLSDASVLQVLAEVGAIANDADRLQTVLAGIAATRSARELGKGGLAAGQGFPTPSKLIQSITGSTKADADRQVRVGSSLIEMTDAVPSSTPEPMCGPVTRPVPWDEPLRRGLLEGGLTTAQSDAIRRGLGEPHVDTAEEGSVASVDPEAAAARKAMIREAWSLAAEGLVAEAASMPVEELAKRARTVRDILDPVGAEHRYARRFESRSIRSWVDADGQHKSMIVWDDEMGLFVEAALRAALRPRRSGPRFMTDEERAAAEALVDDPRTNEQLAYDLFADLVRAGTLANAKDVFGSRQPGVRMVVVCDGKPRDPFGRLLATGHAEDGGAALPGSVIERNRCNNGAIEVIIRPDGSVFDLGREARLFSSTQRLVLAIRDGGCLWPECDRPASYCEAHHCDHYAEGGRTDVDRGVLLCRFHHMTLHNQGWRITRDGLGPFVLHPPAGQGAPIVLVSKAAWKWAWDPPPPPDRGGWREPPEPGERPGGSECPGPMTRTDVEPLLPPPPASPPPASPPPATPPPASPPPAPVEPAA